jgi:hypothetical protein
MPKRRFEMRRIFFAAKNYKHQWVIYSTIEDGGEPEVEVIVETLAEIFQKIAELNRKQEDK